MNVDLWTRLQKPVGLVAASALCLSSVGLVGCMHTPNELFGDRSQPTSQHHASRSGSRLESDGETRHHSRSLSLSRDAAESDDPFLKEDRRSLNRQPVETAARRTNEGSSNRRAELMAGAKEQPPKSGDQAVAPRSAHEADSVAKRLGERPSPGKVMQVTRLPRSRKNFTTALDEALVDAGESRSDEVELLAPPPEKVAKDSATKPATVTSNPSPMKLVRPIPDEEPSVSANKSAEVPETALIQETVPEVAVAATSPRIEPRIEVGKPSLPSRPSEPFVVRIRPAAQESATVNVPIPQIARVNASQGPRDVVPLTQSIHTDETSAPIGTSEKQPPRVPSAATSTSIPQFAPPLIAPASTVTSPSFASPNVPPVCSPQIAMLPSSQPPISVRLEQAVEPEDDPQPLALATGRPNIPMTSIATGPALIAPPATHESDPATWLPSPAHTVPATMPLSGDATVTTPQKNSPIWFWLGGLCGACGLLGLIAFSRLERLSFARAAAPKRDHSLIYKLKLRRHQSATVAKVAERSAA